MTSEAGGDGKVYHRRRERRTQLHEAGASALAGVQPQSPSDPVVPEGGESKRRIITGIASGCAPA
jgi:hypothetical protein